MARDVADGFLQITVRSFLRMSASEMDKINFEMDRRLREIRGSQPDLADTQALQKRNRRMQRLSRARMVLAAFRRQRRI